jgi:hypothetical protein
MRPFSRRNGSPSSPADSGIEPAIPPRAGLTATRNESRRLLIFQISSNPSLLDGPFQPQRLTSSSALRSPYQLPRSFPSLCGFGSLVFRVIVLFKAPDYIARLSAIISLSCLTSQNVDPNPHRNQSQGFALAFQVWLPFVNSFRTFVVAPTDEIKAMFEAIKSLTLT